jgi:hypothetical protein
MDLISEVASDRVRNIPVGGKFEQVGGVFGAFWLVPTPSEDTGLLGRTFVRPPDATFSLEEQSQPNPCEAELSAAAPANMSNHYENAIDVSASSSASGAASYQLVTAEGKTSSRRWIVSKYAAGSPPSSPRTIATRPPTPAAPMTCGHATYRAT